MMALKGGRFDNIITIQKTITGYTCQVQNTELLEMLSTMVQTLGLLYQVVLELLQKQKHGTAGKC
jgi:hypothetical protein